jgi:DNA-binding MarR family transcriptional regulator
VTTRRTPRPAADPDVRRDGLVDALAQSAFLVMGVLTKVSAEHDLSLTQLRVLAILRGRQLRMTELADHLGLEKSTLSGLVDRAESRGLLARSPSETDGRAVMVRLTPAGTKLAARGGDQVRAQLARSVGGLTSSESARLRALLVKLLAGPA